VSGLDAVRAIAHWVASLALSATLLGWPLSALAQDHAKPELAPTQCDIPGVRPDVASRLSCGVVRVPRNHARPEGASFALAVVVIRSQSQPSRPDPVIYISGGPGSPLTIYADPQARKPYAPGRDLILVDQRGTGRSEPSLCPALEPTLMDANLARGHWFSLMGTAKFR
jgi:hypothetical protein